MLEGFHPLVAGWFEERFGTPTEPQTLGWPAIRAGADTLIAAPTGSGKTLAAFLACLDELVREAAAGELADETRVLYVSPLKALSNDVEKNLRLPLREIRERARREHAAFPELRVAVRTGDTPQAERQRMLRRPPHVVVTTPESFYLFLTSDRGRRLLATVRTVIVDEIHAVARDKRGAHLALSLERLDALTPKRATRVGLSATQKPVEEIARFLVGTRRVAKDGTPRCRIVDAGHRRAMELAVEVPRDELSSVATKEQWGETYDRVAELVKEHRSTIVFVNTRRLVERATHALAERLGEERVAAHHGSLAKHVRLDAEQRLKRGELAAIVATASLELGIDVGEVDLVCQLESPRSLSVALQRAGRSGHTRGGTPKARLFPQTRDELVECAALVRGLGQGELERTRLPEWPLDVLAQQLVATCATGEWEEQALYALVTGAWEYRDLPRADFEAVVRMLSEGVSTRRGRSAALLHRDEVNGRLRARRGARISALTGGGAIPDNAQYAVIAEPEGVQVGQLDEDFAVESLAGDVFLLGNTSWRIRRIEAGRVRVEDAQGAPPGVPFWNGEAPGRSAELSRAVSALRAEVERRLGEGPALEKWLAAECGVDEAGARQIAAYLAAAKAALGVLPTQETLVAERFFDDAGGMQLVVHAPFGARLNRGFGLALRKKFCRTFDFELQAAATDEGVLLSLGAQHSFPLESVFDFLTPANVRDTLEQAVLASPMFGARWRWNGTRALAIPRMLGGRKTPPPVARMRADDLMAAVFPAQVACGENAEPGPVEIPDHPLVKETMRDCLTEAMDIDGLTALVERIQRREVRLVARDVTEPSPISHEIVGGKVYSFLDDAPLEERRARAVHLRRGLPAEEMRDLAALDPEAIATVAEQVWPDVRDPDEAHDALLSLGLLSAADAERLQPHAGELERTGRALRTREGHLVATERAWLAAPLGLALASPAPGRFLRAPEGEDTAEAAALRVVRGWAGVLGPFTREALARRLGLDPTAVEVALLTLESQGLLLRGAFTPRGSEAFARAQGWPDEAGPRPPAIEWCEREILARIHRLTLGRLRKEIEPVTTPDLFRFLLRWQHAQPGTQLHGARGLAEVVEQLQGFHAAAGAWEREVLPARVAGYSPDLLDQLCARGEVAWGRLVVAADREEREGAAPAKAEAPRRRNAPTRNAPVTLALRTDLAWLLAFAGPRPQLGSAARQVVEVLAARGALFFGELAQAAGKLPAELERILWELVSAGAVTSDGFAGLRALVHPLRRHEKGRRSAALAGGRWSILCSAPSCFARPGAEPRSSGLGAGPAPADALESAAEQYLRRYGVVFRDLLAREAGAPPWRDLVRFYRRMEARGQIRGGRFASGGFAGEQFALPEALRALRSVRAAKVAGERVELSGADPLNLAGILTPGPRIPATLASRVIFEDGIPRPAPEREARVANLAMPRRRVPRFLPRLP